MHLLTKSDSLYIGDLKGTGYIKDSKGRTDNLKLFIGCSINTITNSTSVSYNISAFDYSEDRIKEEFTDYGLAVDRYNELLKIWDGNRIMEKELL